MTNIILFLNLLKLVIPLETFLIVLIVEFLPSIGPLEILKPSYLIKEFKIYICHFIRE